MKTILLIEDDPFLIDIYTTKLKEVGFSVKVAEEGNKALRILKEHNPEKLLKGRKHVWPDILLLDIVLPNMDGWEILREIKKDPIFKDLKVIILSNLGQKEEVSKGLKLGAVKYLIKAHHTPSEVVKEIKKTL